MSEMWHGFIKEEFCLEGKKAILVYPEKPNGNKDWAMKTEYWDAFPDIEIELLKKGFHIAYIENISRFAPKEDADRKAKFAEYLTQDKGLSEKCVLVGMSLGGAHAVNFAGFYPDKVRAIYLDAPVMSFVGFPGKIGYMDQDEIWENEFLKAYPGMTHGKLLNFDNHPIGKVDILKEHKIPIIMLYGTEDKTVLYEENGKLLELEYPKELLTIVKRNLQGHHPHGSEPYVQTVVEFLL
ncbi:MAG: alpha/beta hydrolase [Clostridia bacterium]|nr:alpha/beta hydrolase [Clostridia bacterium]